jgi:hypothetical protein
MTVDILVEMSLQEMFVVVVNIYPENQTLVDRFYVVQLLVISDEVWTMDIMKMLVLLEVNCK